MEKPFEKELFSRSGKSHVILRLVRICGKGLEKSGNLKLNGCSCPEKLYLFCSRKVVGMGVHFLISMYRIIYLISHFGAESTCTGSNLQFSNSTLSQCSREEGVTGII